MASQGKAAEGHFIGRGRDISSDLRTVHPELHRVGRCAVIKIGLGGNRARCGIRLPAGRPNRCDHRGGVGRNRLELEAAQFVDVVAVVQGFDREHAVARHHWMHDDGVIRKHVIINIRAPRVLHAVHNVATPPIGRVKTEVINARSQSGESNGIIVADTIVHQVLVRRAIERRRSRLVHQIIVAPCFRKSNTGESITGILQGYNRGRIQAGTRAIRRVAIIDRIPTVAWRPDRSSPHLGVACVLREIDAEQSCSVLHRNRAVGGGDGCRGTIGHLRIDFVSSVWKRPQVGLIRRRGNRAANGHGRTNRAQVILYREWTGAVNDRDVCDDVSCRRVLRTIHRREADRGWQCISRALDLEVVEETGGTAIAGVAPEVGVGDEIPRKVSSGCGLKTAVIGRAVTRSTCDRDIAYISGNSVHFVADIVK